MKFGASILTVAFLALSAFAGTRVVVPSLPEAVRPLAEVETNVVFSTGAATDNKWTLTIERDAAASNSVEVVFGCDANEDGVLGIEEGELSVGWDCGEWFWRDRRANAACRVAGSGSRMDWRLRLSSTATSSTEGSDPSVDDVGTTNDWVLAEYDVDPMTGATNRNQVSAQTVALMNTYTNHDCIELYFVGKITNSKAAAFKSVWGIAVSQLATQHVVAHEIGHALGLSDCYNYSEVNSNTTKDFSKIDISGACFASMVRDWGSALGRGFYAKSDKYAVVQQSFLMYGMDGFASVDIPDGAVLSISNKAMSVSSACHVPVGASAIKQNNSEVYSQ